MTMDARTDRDEVEVERKRRQRMGWDGRDKTRINIRSFCLLFACALLSPCECVVCV